MSRFKAHTIRATNSRSSQHAQPRGYNERFQTLPRKLRENWLYEHRISRLCSKKKFVFSHNTSSYAKNLTLNLVFYYTIRVHCTPPTLLEVHHEEVNWNTPQKLFFVIFFQKIQINYFPNKINTSRYYGIRIPSFKF